MDSVVTYWEPDFWRLSRSQQFSFLISENNTCNKLRSAFSGEWASNWISANLPTVDQLRHIGTKVAMKSGYTYKIRPKARPYYPSGEDSYLSLSDVCPKTHHFPLEVNLSPTNKQANRQTDNQTHRQTDKQTHRQTHTQTIIFEKSLRWTQ